MPTHHQSAFFEALRQRDIDLVVHYYRQVDASRLNMGWNAHAVLPSGEHYVEESLRALERCSDWRERIHIVPGCSNLFLLRLAWLLSRQGIPWLHWSEHSRPARRSRVTLYVKRVYGYLADRHALGALAIGELARREFVRWGIRAEKIRFLPYAVSGLAVPDANSMEDATPPGKVRFLFLGQLCERKGIDLLLAAMAGVLTAYPSVDLELAGADRSDGAYARDAERLGIAHAIRFTGVIQADEIGAVFQRNDVLVLPSRHDGWGVVLNEAASLGKAIIASDGCGAAHHLVRPGVNGFRVPVGDIAALANAMKAYVQDPGLAVRHGTEALRIFQEFTPARNALRFEQALTSLRNAGSGAGLAWEA